MDLKKMRVALVYDRINKWGGAERVLLALHEIFPNAPLYTSVYNPKTAPWAKVFDIKTSFLQDIPTASSFHELFAALMPIAFESFCFDEYDLVISVTSEAAKGIITKPKTLHLCYCLTPTRYLWSGYDDYFQNFLLKTLAKPAVSYLRTWDKIASQRPDFYIAISKEVQKRIKKYYNRDSEVIYPPLMIEGARVAHLLPLRSLSQLNEFSNASVPAVASGDRRIRSAELTLVKTSFRGKAPRGQKNDSENFVSFPSPYFLIVSRLVSYKKIDLAIKAFNKLKLPLKIIGTGSEEQKLKNMAGSNIEFLGSLTDEQLIKYYKDCVALVFPALEDFGLTVLEAQKFGKPVIAFKDGGALETVIEGKTGEFFDKQNPESLVKVLGNFDKEKYKSDDCINQANKFNKKIFKKEFVDFINEKMREYFKTKI